MADLFVPDVSEFQPNCDWAAFIAGGFSAAIARAYNGYRADKIWPARRDDMRAKGVPLRGYYCFLVSDVDPVAQARAAISAIGGLAPGEFPVLDSEEVPWHPWTAGQQKQFSDSWFSVVDPWFGHLTPLYCDLSTLRSMGGSAAFPGRPIWVAAYGAGEPSEPHVLWQFTDGHSTSGGFGPVNFAGIGVCDASVHHGDVAELAALMGAAGGTSSAPVGASAQLPAPPAVSSAPPPPSQSQPAPWPGRYLQIRNPFLEGPDVETWQTQMLARGWIGLGSADGVYGPHSESLCLAFQREKGLPVDGIVGPATWDAVWTAAITPPALVG